MAPRAGLEPATVRLTVGCSTTELPRNIVKFVLITNFDNQNQFRNHLTGVLFIGAGHVYFSDEKFRDPASSVFTNSVFEMLYL